MQVGCGWKQFYMPKIKPKPLSYFKRYLALPMFLTNHSRLLDMLIKEIATIKPLTPEKARIRALQTQKDNVSKQLKAERDRQKVAKAQQTIATVKFG